MKHIKMLGLFAVLATALMALAGTASATILTNKETKQLPVGTAIHANSENTVQPVTLHPPVGDITCTSSTVAGTIGNAGSGSTTVSGNNSSLTFGGCNATVTVLKAGSLEIHTRTATADGNGTLTSTGAKVTVVLFGVHCVFETNATDIGTLTGSKNVGGKTATLDIEATIPRTEGSGLCGSTAQWTGNYVVDIPDYLDVD